MSPDRRVARSAVKPLCLQIAQWGNRPLSALRRPHWVVARRCLLRLGFRRHPHPIHSSRIPATIIFRRDFTTGECPPELPGLPHVRVPEALVSLRLSGPLLLLPFHAKGIIPVGPTEDLITRLVPLNERINRVDRWLKQRASTDVRVKLLKSHRGVGC